MAAGGIRRLQSALHNRSFRFMVRLCSSFFLVISSILLFKSLAPLVSFVRQEMLPHLRDSIFNSHSFLFVLINPIIFAVLFPSGLFSTFRSDNLVCPSPDPDESPPVVVEEAPSSTNSTEMPAEPSSEAQETPKTQVVRRNKSPRVKKVRKMKNSSTISSKIFTMGIVEPDESAGNPRDSARNQRDSLKDEDFKQFIDTFIARAHQQMIRQERELARSFSTPHSS